MTKDEFLENVDVQEGDKLHFIRIRTNKDGALEVQRIAHNFSAIELLGYMEQAQLDILEQIRGNIKPEIVERKILR